MKLVTANTNLLFLHHSDRDFDQPTVNDGVVGATFPPSAATTNRPPTCFPLHHPTTTGVVVVVMVQLASPLS